MNGETFQSRVIKNQDSVLFRWELLLSSLNKLSLQTISKALIRSRRLLLFPYFCAAANREHHLNCSLFLPNPLYNSMIEQSHKQLFTIMKSNNYAMILVNPCSCREVNNVVISKMLDYWSFLSNSGAEARIFLFPSIIGIMEDRRVSIKPVI